MDGCRSEAIPRDLDILVFNHHQPPSLRRSNLTGSNQLLTMQLKVRLEGVRSNRTVIGAMVATT